jgi:hypothetical protein
MTLIQLAFYCTASLQPKAHPEHKKKLKLQALDVVMK